MFLIKKILLPFALFLLGAIALTVSSGYSVGFYVLCLMGLLSSSQSLRASCIRSDFRYFYWPMVLYSVGNLIMAFADTWSMREIGIYLPYLIAIFGYCGIRYYKPRAEWFWLGIAIGALGAALLAGYQSMFLGMRAGGHTHPIQFGNIALLMGVLCLVRVIANPIIDWLNSLMCLGFISGLAASIWSQTRGGWIAVGFILIWIFATAAKKWQRGKLAIASIMMVIIMIIPILHTDSLVVNRINEAVSEVNSFIVDNKQDTSVGIRLAMWGVAIHGIKDAPLIGHGMQGWIDARDAAIKDGRLSSFSAGLSHIHNEYIDAAFKRGLVGLALLLSMYLIPMLFYFRPHLHDDSESVRALSMAGMLVPMMYMDFGLTQVFLSHNSGRIVLVGFLMCIAALMSNAIDDKGHGE